MLRVLIHTAASPAADLALEEAIQLAIEDDKSPNTWRIWQAAVPAVILGTGQESAREANLQFAAANKLPVLRRHSGGGAVVIGPGAINFSAFYRFNDLAGSETIRGAMSGALRYVIRVLEKWDVRAREAGTSDLAALGADGTLRKIAGNSQARKRRSVLVHGTLLANPDFTLIQNALNFPSSIPDYRSGRDHRAFLTSLHELSAPCDLKSFTNELLAALPSDKFSSAEPTEDELTRAGRLLIEKYGTDTWNLRR